MLASPYLSPNRAPGETFAGYPKTFISLGGAEVFVEEVHELAEKMERNGVDVRVDVQVCLTSWGRGWHRLTHVPSLLAGRHPRLFGISERISERWGSR